MENIASGTRERALLLGLMTLGGSASNPELRDHVGDALDGEPRRRMNKLGLVESDKSGRAYHHTLTEEGWAWCVAELAGTAPARGGSLGRTLYGVLGMIRGYLDATDLSLADFVGTARANGIARTDGTAQTDSIARTDGTAQTDSIARTDGTAQADGTADTAPDDLAEAIRDVYWRLASEPQDWVLLTRLRPLLGDTPRDEVDEALRRMEQLPDVHLVPEADQKTLTDADREAAVLVSGVSKHLLAIEAR